MRTTREVDGLRIHRAPDRVTKVDDVRDLARALRRQPGDARRRVRVATRKGGTDQRHAAGAGAAARALLVDDALVAGIGAADADASAHTAAAVSGNVARRTGVTAADAGARRRHFAAIRRQTDTAAATGAVRRAGTARVRAGDADARRDLVEPGRASRRRHVDADAAAFVPAGTGRQIEAERCLVIDRLADDLRSDDGIVTEHAGAGLGTRRAIRIGRTGLRDVRAAAARAAGRARAAGTLAVELALREVVGAAAASRGVAELTEQQPGRDQRAARRVSIRPRARRSERGADYCDECEGDESGEAEVPNARRHVRYSFSTRDAPVGA